MAVQCRSQRFIDDLVPLILESDEHWWPRDLLRLALVSPAWLGLVRRRLYAHPRLNSFRACNLFARTITDNPALLPLIHALDLCPFAYRGSSQSALNAHDMQCLRRILNLENLRSLTLGGELVVGAERFLQSLSGSRTITELHIDGNPGNGLCGPTRYTTKPASLEWDHTIAFRFPNLRKLTFSHLELDVAHPPMPYSLKLQELNLNKVDIIGGWLPNLANESWGHLRSLSIVARQQADFDDHIRLILECCDNLRSLHYEVRDCSRESGIFDGDLEPCPSLEELHLSGVDMSPEILTMIGRSFENLERLTVFGRNVSVTPEEWTTFLKSRALPSLHELHLPNGNGPPFKYWSEEMGRSIREACTARQLNYHCAFLSLSESARKAGHNYPR